MYIEISAFLRKKLYKFNPWFGILYSRNCSESRFNINLPKYNSSKLHKKISLVLNPFKVAQTPQINQKNHKDSKLIILYAKTLLWCYNHFYFGLFLLSHLRLKIYDNAADASDSFCRIVGYKNQKVLCLPRSIFSATTSKKFSKHGCLFIGAFLPSRHMHAWVIEENYNSWRYDMQWINYIPISVMI